MDITCCSFKRWVQKICFENTCMLCNFITVSASLPAVIHCYLMLDLFSEFHPLQFYVLLSLHFFFCLKKVCFRLHLLWNVICIPTCLRNFMTKTLFLYPIEIIVFQQTILAYPHGPYNDLDCESLFIFVNHLTPYWFVIFELNCCLVGLGRW